MPNLSRLPIHRKTLHDARAQSEGIKPFIISYLFSINMVKTLRYYWHPDCGGCEELKPAFKELAELKGWKYKEINIETCKSKRCNAMEYVPTVFVGSKKLNLKEMEKLLNE